jgi:hypothetical protein
MPALNPARRFRVVTTEAPRPRMPVVVKLPDGFTADMDSLTARARQVQTSTRGFTTPETLKATYRDLLAIETLARTAREKLG